MDHQDQRFPRTAFWCVVLAALVGLGPAMAPCSWSQPLPSPSAHRGAAIPRFVHQLWTADDGLPVNSINDVLQTRDGYLWLTTYDGLVRFDGVRFTVFNTQNTEGLTTNRMVLLLEDREGTLWISTETEGLVRFSEGTVKTYPVGAITGGTPVNALVEDRAGNLWIGVELGVLRLSPDETVTAYTTDDGLVGNPVRTILESRDGSLWLGTYSGLSRLKDGTFTNYTTDDGLSDDVVTALHEDAAGTLWIGTSDGGLNRLKDGAFTSYDTDDGLAHITVRFLHEDPEGRLWVGTKGGLNLLRRDTTGGTEHISFVSYTTEDGLSENDVSNIWQDREGSFWIGTQTGGLNRFTATPFEILSREQGLSNTTFLALFEARDGSMWIGAGCEGLNHLKDGQVRVYTMADGLSSNCIWSIYEDDEGSIWAGTYTWGLNRLKEGAVTVYGKEDGLPGGAILAIYQDRQGHLWFGTSKGLARWDDGTFIAYTEDDGLAHNWVRAIYEDRAGTLWLGTNGGGLSRFDGHTFTNFTTAEGLSNDRVRSIYEDEEGTFWIGTEGGGLNRFKDGTFTAFTMEDGLLDNTIHQILEDRQGNLWMSSNRGLFHVSRAMLNGYANGQGGALEVISYGKKDGLRDPEFNGGFQYAGIETRDGRFWFPSVAGVVSIHPDDIHRNTLPPPVVVERVLAGNAPVVHSPRLALAKDQRSFEIEYTGLSLLVPEKVRFKYQLVGYDRDWVEAGARRTAFYTKVPPGAYTFRVKASNNDGVWNEEGAALAVTVAPYFYETTWFQLLAAFFGLIALAAGYGWRVRQLKQREQVLNTLVQERTKELREEKEQTEQQREIAEQALETVAEQAQKLAELDQAKSRFFANISHEFRTPLTLILGPLQRMLDGVFGRTSDALHEQHHLMQRNAQRLLHLINQILDLASLESGSRALRAGPGDLGAFVRQLVQAFTPLAERNNVTLTFWAACETCTVYFDPDHLEKVVTNLLSNALKFTPRGGTVDVVVRESDTHAEIAVEDTGVGIPAEKLPHVFDRFYQVDDSATRMHEGTGIGLALAKELVELHGGAITVESEPEQGSTFTVRLRKGRDHLDESQVVEDEQAGVWEVEHVGVWAYEGVEDGGDRREDAEPELDVLQIDQTTVLVIDDNADMRAYVRSILEPTYRVLEASDGQAGFETARKALPDLILADVMMPRMDGLALSKVLKQNPMLDCIPVILLTAKAGTTDEIAGLATGVDDYVTKPFEAEVLRARVENLIAQRQRLRERYRAGPDLGAFPPAATESDFAARLREVIYEHLTDGAFSVEALAGEMALSRSWLYRKVREEFGLSPNQLIQQIRLERAVQLLKEQAGNISEVAYAVGFNSLSYFNRCFRAHFDLAPSEYLRAHV